MKKTPQRLIAHVDMDAFFAAVEQLRNPELRGKPVIVGADPQQGKGRGVVSTASYEARPYGVHSAMPISQAYRLCPHAIYLRPNISLYSQYSKQVFQVLEHFTPAVQAVSIDEAFMDVGGTVHIYGSAWKLGTEIKKQIYEETQLTASVGIAPGKSVAKIASDFQKPDGLVVVNVNEVQQFLEALPVTKLWGVGKKTFETLSKLGINTVKQLREFRLEWLEQSFGKLGHHLYQIARGIDDREVTTREEIKSVSHETTFEIDQTDPEVLLSTLLSLSEKVSSRLRKYGLRGKTIQIKLRFSDFTTFTRNRTLFHYTNITEEIFAISQSLFQQFEEQDKSVRLIGVGVSQLVDEKGMQTSLWDIDNERKVRLEKVADQLREKFGNSALTRAQTLAAKRQSKKK